jgi:hypothetical protein
MRWLSSTNRRKTAQDPGHGGLGDLAFQPGLISARGPISGLRRRVFLAQVTIELGLGRTFAQVVFEGYDLLLEVGEQEITVQGMRPLLGVIDGQ